MSNLIPKQIFYLAIINVVLYLLLPLEIYGFQSRYIVYPFIWISLSIVGFNFFPPVRSFVDRIFMAFGMVIYLIITSIFAFVFFAFCRWSDHGVRYSNKEQISLKLICRTYDCYGTTDDCRLYKQRRLLGDIYWITEFEESTADTAVWENCVNHSNLQKCKKEKESLNFLLENHKIKRSENRNVEITK